MLQPQMSPGPMSVAQALITSSRRHGGTPPPGERDLLTREYKIDISELIWLLMTSLGSQEPWVFAPPLGGLSIKTAEITSFII